MTDAMRAEIEGNIHGLESAMKFLEKYGNAMQLCLNCANFYMYDCTCHRYAPRPDYSRHLHGVSFPTMPRLDFCGEHKLYPKWNDAARELLASWREELKK